MLAAEMPAAPQEPELADQPAAPSPEAVPGAAPTARKTRKPPPAKKARPRARPGVPAAAAPAPGKPVFVPTVSYERLADTLRIELLDEPVSDERRTEKLKAGYTADGRLAGLLIFDVAKHAEPPAPALALPAQPAGAPDPLWAAKLDKLHEELRVLKTGLALALGGLAIALLRIF